MTPEHTQHKRRKGLQRRTHTIVPHKAKPSAHHRAVHPTFLAAPDVNARREGLVLWNRFSLEDEEGRQLVCVGRTRKNSRD